MTSVTLCASNCEMIDDRELERVWEEVGMVYFKVLSRHLPGKVN
jgi:hypothetical protein